MDKLKTKRAETEDSDRMKTLTDRAKRAETEDTDVMNTVAY